MKSRLVNALAICSFSGFVLIERLLEMKVIQELYLPDEYVALVAAIFVALAYALVSKYVFVDRDSRIALLVGLVWERWECRRENLLASRGISEVDVRGRI